MRRAFTLLGSMVLASACGCITGNGAAKQKSVASDPKQKSVVSDARVKPVWQDFLIKTVKDTGGDDTEGFGLFSEGGWSDAGQVMIIVAKDKAPRLLVVQTGHPKVDIDRALTAAEWGSLKPVLSDSKSLETIDVEAFDALTFELAHAVMSKEGAVIDRRVYYRNPGKKPSAAHEAFINAFQALKKGV